MPRRLLPLPILLLLLCLGPATGCTPAGETETVTTEAGVEDTTARPAWVENAVLYELFVTDFTPEGTFRAVIPRLPELKALGVTTIWLMPIHPIGLKKRKGTLGSPYAIQDFFAVNPAYGTPDDFRALVEAVHAQGMHLIIDLVANHTAWDNAWIDEHPDWYTHDAAGRIVSPVPDWSDVADLNYNVPAVRAEMKRAMRYWVEQFDIDGYRCDVAEMVPGDFWADAIAELRSVKPVMMLAEGETPDLHENGFDLTYSWRLYQTLKQVWQGDPLTRFFAVLDTQQTQFPPDALRLRFTTNHDETAWDAPPPVRFGSFEGARAAAVLMTTLPGVPLLYNGQEAGVAQNVVFFERNPIDWSQHPEMRLFYKDLMALRHGSGALRSGAMNVLARGNPDVALFERAGGGERLVVAVNVRNKPASISLPEALRGARLKHALTGEDLRAADTLPLPAYGYALLRVEG